MGRSWGFVVVLLFAASCSFRASCGDSNLNVTKLKNKIEENIESETKLAVSAVVCPESVKLKQGDVFECTVTVADSELVYVVTQEDGEGNVTWKVRDGVVVSAKLEGLIATKLQEKFGTAPRAVECGQEIRPSKPGSTFECIATDPTGKRWRVGVTVTDEIGGVDFKLIGPKSAGAPAPAPAGN